MMNNRETELLKKAQQLSDTIQEIESIDVDSAYQRTMKKIQKNRYRRFNSLLMRSAAVLSLPLLISSLLFGYLYVNSSSQQNHYAEVNVANGTIVKYQLPDQSIVYLNSGSKLRYPVQFDSDKREVELSGEGYFEVTADQEHPFYVNTPSGLSVYVYGTKFNVRAYADDKFVETVLESGKVNIITPQKKVATIKPGQQIYYNKESEKLLMSEADVYVKTAWKDGKLIFRNASLEEVLEQLSRHFNVDIEFNNHSHKTYKYRATFRDENLNQILHYLGESAHLKWRISKTTQNEDASFERRKIKVDLY